jgi:hypothetical protein
MANAGTDKYMRMLCTEGCLICYHYLCWRAFERFHKASHPEFNWKARANASGPSAPDETCLTLLMR